MPKSLKRQRGYARKGSKIISVRDEYINERYSMILMTVPNGIKRPFAARIFGDTIDASKFIMFIFNCILSGHLRRGNYLIMDNASLHFSDDTYEILLAMLKGAGVKLRFLPTYSPEFNPSEFLFGLFKNAIRNGWGLGSSLLEEILLALNVATHKHLAAFYYHCMFEAEL